MRPATVRAVAVLAGTVLLLGGCSGDDGGKAGPGKRSDMTFAVVTHSAPGDSFWDVVKKGAEKAAADLGVKVTYQGSGNPAEQADMINAAVTAKVRGLVVSMANPDALKEPIAAAVRQGIPVITINSGQDQSAGFGAIAHVGQDEVVAGRAAGQRLGQAGVRKLLCVKHEAANIGLDQRCNGAADGLRAAVEPLQVDINNPAEAQNTIASKVQADAAVDGVLTLNPTIAIAAVDAVGRTRSSVKVATFDLSRDVVDAILADKLLFAVDQQQYLQGYLPVVQLTLYVENANTVGGGQPVLTGPGFVTKENAAKVKELTGQGTR